MVLDDGTMLKYCFVRTENALVNYDNTRPTKLSLFSSWLSRLFHFYTTRGNSSPFKFRKERLRKLQVINIYTVSLWRGEVTFKRIMLSMTSLFCALSVAEPPILEDRGLPRPLSRATSRWTSNGRTTCAISMGIWWHTRVCANHSLFGHWGMFAKWDAGG